MLARDIKVVDLGAVNRDRLRSLAGQSAARLAARWSKSSLLVIYRGLKPLKAVELSSGKDVNIDFMGSSRLDALSDKTGFDRVLAVEESAPSRVFAHARRTPEYDDDVVRQCLALLEGVASEWGRTIFTYPRMRGRIPVPPYAAVDATVRFLVPDDSLVLLAITERGRAWASIVFGYRAGEFWLISSLDTLGAEDADLSDGALEAAARKLEDKYGGTVRAVVMEKDSLLKAMESRFPTGAALWALNTSTLRTLNVPLRCKAVALLALRRVNSLFRMA